MGSFEDEERTSVDSRAVKKTRVAQCAGRKLGSRQMWPGTAKRLPWLKLGPEAAKSCLTHRACDGGPVILDSAVLTETMTKGAIQMLSGCL